MLQKIEHYISALAQLEQAVAIYQKSQQDALYRDGLIQRFEFTVELAWKSIKEYLEDQGSTTPIATPRAVLKEAFAAGLIQDAEEWNKIITARNITSYNKIVVFIDRSPAECYNKFRMLWIGMYHLPQRRVSGGSNHSFFVEMLIS